VAVPELTVAPMPVAATAEAISLAGAMAAMAEPAVPLVLTLPAESIAVEVTAGEAATAVAVEAINGPALLYQDREGRRIIPEVF
jgi:hypothetical protein